MFFQKSCRHVFGKQLFVVMNRKLMTKQERLVGEMIALHDASLESIMNKSDKAHRLIEQSLFDRQIQEYIHRQYRIPIDRLDRSVYRLNSVIIHHPSRFDGYDGFLDQHRFLSDLDYEQCSRLLDHFPRFK